MEIVTDSFFRNLTESKQSHHRLMALTLLVALLLTIWTFSPLLSDKYLAVNDVRNYYWMARAQDPTLFARDYIYFAGGDLIEKDILNFHIVFDPFTLGYSLIFYLCSSVVDYVWLIKLSIPILTAVCVIYIFKLGCFLDNGLTALSLSLFFIFFMLASPQSISLATGLPRAFVMPLMIPFLYYLVSQKYLKACLMIFMSTLFYLPAFPPMVLAYGVSLFGFKHPIKVSLAISKNKIFPFIATLVFSSFIVALALAAQLNLLPTPDVEPLNTSVTLDWGDSLTNNPAFQGGGAMPLFIGFPFLGRAGVFDTGADVINFLVLAILSFLIYKSLGPKSWRHIPGGVWGLLIAGLVMYALAVYTLLSVGTTALYLPSRYTRSTLFLSLLCFVGLNWIAFLKVLPQWLLRNIRLIIFFFVTFGLALALVYLFSSNRGLLIPTLWLVGVILLAILVPFGVSVFFWLVTTPRLMKKRKYWGGVLISGIGFFMLGMLYVWTLGLKTPNPSLSERALYEFVATLPKDAMIAGDPEVMTNIPLFSKRSVLFRALFPSPNAPFIEYFDAQYAENVEPIIHFCQRYKVDYLVINTAQLTPDYIAKQKFFYDPWNDAIVERVADHSNFIMPHLEPVFASGPFRVIKCDPETMPVDTQLK